MNELYIKDIVLEADGHSLKAYDWDASDGWKDRLSDHLIPIIHQLYLDCEGLKKDLEDIGFNPENIKIFIDDALKASIPSGKRDHTPKNLKVSRADMAEILALICLEGLHHTNVPVSNTFSRELTHASGRGLDILGYEKQGNDIALIICEVKGSADKNSPPAVVESGADSLKTQLYSYISNKEKTLNRIMNVHKKASAAHKSVLAQIAFMWSKEDMSPLKVIVCPFLVRQQECYTCKDFGSFKENPDYFQPAKVRFLVVCIHEDLDILSNFIYTKASGVQ